jgi:hypothetical protein
MFLVEKREGKLVHARCQLIKAFVSINTFEDPGVNATIILKCILQKWDVMA